MKVIEVTQNKYKRNFITIEVEGNESFKGSCYKFLYDYSMHTTDKSGRTHEINIRREKINEGFASYNEPKYKDTYCVGAGNGANMGWDINLTKREAFKIARARMQAIQSYKLVARIYTKNKNPN